MQAIPTEQRIVSQCLTITTQLTIGSFGFCLQSSVNPLVRVGLTCLDRYSFISSPFIKGSVTLAPETIQHLYLRGLGIIISNVHECSAALPAIGVAVLEKELATM